MKAKGGKAVTAVEPPAPEAVIDADVADPGKIAEVKAVQAKAQEGKYGSTKIPAHKPPKSQGAGSQSSDGSKAEEDNAADEEKTDFIEIELLDEEGNGVSGEKYEIELPDGSLAKGTLDGKGFARVEGVKPGQCKVTFPELDESAWS